MALHYLLCRGYSLLGRNVRIGHDEIDIIVYDPMDDVITFVEVKTRSADHPDYTPMLNVTSQKTHRLQRAAEQWIADQEREWGWRIDVILVVGEQVQEHIKDILA